MRGPAVLFFVFVLGGAGARGADDPRAVLQRAIQVMGGEAKLAPEAATRATLKGTIHLDRNTDAPFTADVLNESGRRYRAHLKVMLDGGIQLLEVYDGKNGWQRINGDKAPVEDHEVKEWRAQVFRERVLRLVPLVKEKGFTLTPLGDSKVGDQPATGIKVSFVGQPDTSLYFDKKTGLLVKFAYRGKESGGKEAQVENLLSDYRVVDATSAAARALKTAGVKAEGDGALEYLRKQMPSADRLARVKALIRKLGDPDFDVREKAESDLIALGSAAAPLLRQAAKDSDIEIARRAGQCLKKVREQTSPAVVHAAIRLVAVRHPAGAAEVLLTYLGGTDEATAEEVRAALFALAQHDGQAKEALTRALKDKDAVRRAAAEAALGKDGGAYARRPGRRLYLDGIKYPHKVIDYRDGKKNLEYTVEEMAFFNRFEDKLFTQP